MDTVTKILGIVGPIIGSLVGASPLGAILLGVAGIGVLIGGIVLFNKFKNWKFTQTHNTEVEQAAQDLVQVIVNNQQQSVGDSATVDSVDAQAQKDKEKLKPKP